MSTKKNVTPEADRASKVKAFRDEVRGVAGDDKIADEQWLQEMGSSAAQAKTLIEGTDADAAREIAKGPDGYPSSADLEGDDLDS